MSIGIDIGLSTVKIVEIVKNGNKYFVEKAGIKHLIPELSKYNPDKINKSHWVSAIQDLSKELGIQTKKVKCITSNISGKNVSVRQITTLEMNKEKTDERLNQISHINKKVITILSGKWNTSVGLAKKLNKML